MDLRRASVLVVNLCLSFAVAPLGAAHAQARSEALPLTRVRLYETGVGYFERHGRIRDATRLPVPRTHLDDALKTLVILGGDAEGGLESVRFDSLLTGQLGRALARLPTEPEQALDFEDFARSLVGADVVIETAGQRYAGRLLQIVDASTSSLERCLPGAVVETRGARDSGANADAGGSPCVLRKQGVALLLTPKGALRRFALSEVDGLRAARRADADRLRDAFASAAGSARDAHQLEVRGPLGGEVTLGYIAEAPLWRTTYRLVLAASGSQLQAWALLHNDGAEDWSQVRVELVNGQPDSFLFPLTAPRYAERRLVTPEAELPSVPQLLSTGPDELWDSGDEGGGYGYGGLGLRGRGAGSGGAAVVSGAATNESSLLSIGDLAQFAQAQGVESGALFRYTVPKPVDLVAHSSLLVPLLQHPVDARRLSYLAVDAKVATSALLLANDTPQTLPAGTVAVFEDGGFGGESALDRLKPAERQLLPYGVDLDVTRKPGRTSTRERRRAVRFAGGQLVEHYERARESRFELHNRSAVARTAFVALDVVNNAKVERADAVSVLSDGATGALYELAASTRRTVDLRVVEGLKRSHGLAKLGAGLLSRMARDEDLPATERQLLGAAQQKLEAAERARRRSRWLGARIALFEDKAKRERESLPIVAKADAERGKKLAAELVSTERAIAECKRALAETDPAAPLAAARAVLRRLGSQ